ncbi:MAG: cytochrome c-type biogenesis protein [Pseudomonadota bacterium]
MKQLSLFTAVLVLFAQMAVAGPAWAVDPEEVLSDPALEKRARNLSAGLRCLVCQNQSIDDSDADLAKDLRLRVRERLVAGDTDEQVIDYLIDRYGEFVLLRPRFGTHTLLLWSVPIIGLLIAGVVVFRSTRKTAAVAQPGSTAPLTEEEQKKLDQLLGEHSRDDT